LDFKLPVWSHSIATRSTGMLDLENLTIGVGVVLLSCLGAELYAFEVFMLHFALVIILYILLCKLC